MAKVMHYASFGLYTRRAPRDDNNLEVLRRDRRVESLMAYLRQVRNAGQRPEVMFPAEQIQTAVDSLSALMSQNVSSRLRKEAASVIEGLQRETKDDTLLASCHQALTALNTHPRSAHPAPAVAALPRVVTSGSTSASLPAE
jgi:predicted DNA-binding transcriptional regulator YafY